MRIVDLHGAGTPLLERCAELLVEAFRDLAPTAWPGLEQSAWRSFEIRF